MEKKIEQLRTWVSESSRMVFFGGAGVSTESGIPDFRSADGLYSQKFQYPPEVMLSHSFYERQPEAFFQFYREKLLPLEYEPNAAHRKLAQWEQEGKLLAVVTQNVDGLHEKAGSKRVYHLHGTIYRNTCQRCGRRYDGLAGALRIRDAVDIPRCECGGVIKPDVVLYEEGLDEQTVEGAVRAIAAADLLIVGGTSLTVYPAAGLLRYYRGKRLVLINRDVTSYDDQAALTIHAPIGQVFREL